jgi:hypothetical protein
MACGEGGFHYRNQLPMIHWFFEIASRANLVYPFPCSPITVRGHKHSRQIQAIAQ